MIWTEIALGVIVFALCLGWYAWTSGRLRTVPEERRFRRVEPREAGGKEEGEPEYVPKDLPTTYDIARDCRIAYARHVYLNTPFELKATFALPGGLGAIPAGQLAHDDPIAFTAAEPQPPVRVKLSYAEGAFEADSTEQEQPLKATGETVFSFWLKPLKAETCLVTVEIAYAGEVTVPETVEQIQVSTEQSPAGSKTTRTEIRKPGGKAKSYQELRRATLEVRVASFLGMNPAELGLLGKGLGAGIAVILVLISFATGQSLDWGKAVELLILGVATPLGVSVYDGLAPK